MWNKTHWPIENNYKDQYSRRLSTSASCTLNHIRFTIDSQKIKNKNKTIIHFTTSINLKIHVFFIKKKKKVTFPNFLFIYSMIYICSHGNERKHLICPRPTLPFLFVIRAPTTDVGYVPNAKYLAHIPHQTKFDPIYQML